MEVVRPGNVAKVGFQWQREVTILLKVMSATSYTLKACSLTACKIKLFCGLLMCLPAFFWSSFTFIKFDRFA